MELNAEITKVVGNQVATLLKEKIPEEELEKEARNAWEYLTQNSDEVIGGKNPSIIQNYVKEFFFSKLVQYIEKIAKEPKTEQELEDKARLIIQKAEAVAEEAMIKEMATNIIEGTLHLRYNGQQKVNEAVMKAFNMCGERFGWNR